MKFMVIVKASVASEAGVMPSTQLLADMGKFNDELVKAGVLLSAEGLHPSSRGARIRFQDNQRSVIDGPFAETKELIAGYWLIEVSSREEAIEWMKRAPNPHDGVDSEIEIRQVFSEADFGEALTPELRAQEAAIREQLAP
ncbi:MAG: YciI family protein [Oxalobacteraceae bacterium]|nr:MAG: YciI family protein [Oxalobacteraceae bacterium]